MKDLSGNTKPVNKTAARVVGRGEEYTPNKKIMVKESRAFLRIRPHPYPHKDRELIGRKFGRLTVIGYSAEQTKKSGAWVCRCDCGTYCIRRATAIRNPKNNKDRCEECRQLAFLKRREAFEKYGEENDWEA